MSFYDHIIVGGGILGASIAYHISKKSNDTILVLERNDFASGASSRSAGLVLQGSTKKSNIPLAKKKPCLLENGPPTKMDGPPRDSLRMSGIASTRHRQPVRTRSSRSLQRPSSGPQSPMWAVDSPGSMGSRPTASTPRSPVAALRAKGVQDDGGGSEASLLPLQKDYAKLCASHSGVAIDQTVMDGLRCVGLRCHGDA